MAEWSCSGLQSRVRRFDSDSGLHRQCIKPASAGFLLPAIRPGAHGLRDVGRGARARVPRRVRRACLSRLRWPRRDAPYGLRPRARPRRRSVIVRTEAVGPAPCELRAGGAWPETAGTHRRAGPQWSRAARTPGPFRFQIRPSVLAWTGCHRRVRSAAARLCAPDAVGTGRRHSNAFWKISGSATLNTFWWPLARPASTCQALERPWNTAALACGVRLTCQLLPMP